MWKSYLTRFGKMYWRDLFGGTSSLAWLIGTPALIGLYALFDTAPPALEGLIGDWAVSVAGFASTLAIMIVWKFIYTPFQIFKEDQEQISSLKADPQTFEIRRLEALEESNRLKKLEHSPAAIMRRAEMEQFAKMLHPPFQP